MTVLRLLYFAIFAGSAGACFIAAARARRISDRDTRVGLTALLTLSGLWASTSVARLLPYPVLIQRMFYTLGLVAGLASVGAWLYFCSAYTGRDYHRNPRLRWVATITFALVVSIKLTNPLHNLYFSASEVTDPFAHVAIQLHAIHWVTTGFSYSLAAIGFYMLYELFTDSHLDTRALAALVAVTGVPALVDLIAYGGMVPSLILEFNYEPIGVAVFAIGALFVIDEQFVAVPEFWRQEVIDDLEEAVIVVDPDGHVREYNTAAEEVFPSLSDAIRSSLKDAVPALENITDTQQVIEHDGAGDTQYLQVDSTALEGGAGQDGGRVLICMDVTEIERHRRELQRQTDQFDAFADAIAHELRNATCIIDGYLTQIADQVTDSTTEDDDLPIEEMVEEVERLQMVIEELTTMARHSQPVDVSRLCDVETAANAGYARSSVEGLPYEVEPNRAVDATEQRLATLFSGVFAFFDAIGASSVDIAVERTSIDISGVGGSFEDSAIDQALSYGEPVPSVETGMALPNARMVTRSFGWDLTVGRPDEETVRIHVAGVTTG